MLNLSPGILSQCFQARDQFAVKETCRAAGVTDQIRSTWECDGRKRSIEEMLSHTNIIITRNILNNITDVM